MIIRLTVIFLPYFLGFVCVDAPELSVTCSVIGSLVIALVAQTNWFRQANENISVKGRLLRPTSMHHLIFVAFHVVGGCAYALNATGYTVGGAGTVNTIGTLADIAECQRLMLLGHTCVTIGMKLVGFKQPKAKYVMPELPPFSLIAVSFFCLSLGTLVSSFPTLAQLSQKLFAISGTAISVDIPICIVKKRKTNLLASVTLLLLNIFYQSVSGWKGGILWIAIMVGALLYPLLPRTVLLCGTAFILFWILFFHPFGLALRPLVWSEGFDRDRAVDISLNHAINMSFAERVDNMWIMLVGRANELPQFIRYLEYVPGRHDYFEVELISNSLIAMVPRVIWPEKPDLEQISMQRVLEANVVENSDIVSAKSNFYQDAYLSWGAWGIVIGCIFLGVVIMLLQQLCEVLFGGYEIGTCLIFTSLFGQTANLPPNFEFFFSSIAVGIVFVMIIFMAGRAANLIKPSSPIDSLSKSDSLQAQSNTTIHIK